MVVMRVVAASVLALVAAGAPWAPVDAQTTGPIRVIDASHEVHFPDEVRFKLEAQSTSPITQVTLFYRLGGRESEVYGYPEFRVGTSVSAGFTLRTGGSRFIPSGVGIQYHYRIGDSEGNDLQTPAYSLEYRDPRYRWRELRRGNMVILYHDLPAERVADVAAKVDQRLEEAVAVVGLEEMPPVKAVILNGRREADRTFPPVSRAARRGHLYAGFAYAEYDLFVLAGLGVDGMVHEATHLLVDEALSSPRARLPAWLNEGLAMYFESPSSHRRAAVERAARRGGLLSLRSTNTIPGRPQDVRMFYSQSWSVVDHMIDTYGTERMTALLKAINNGVGVEDSITEVYGVSLGELESRWKREVTGVTTLAARPDPGTVGTTFLISGAVAVALLVSAYRWLAGRTRQTEPEDLGT